MNDRRLDRNGRRPTGRPRADMTGRRVGHWLVLRPGAHDARGTTAWWCRCDCGTECVVPARSLQQGRPRSCGCVGRGRPRTPEHERRDRQIVAARRRGDTLDEIALCHGLTRQRVQQVIKAAQQQADARRRRA